MSTTLTEGQEQALAAAAVVQHAALVAPTWVVVRLVVVVDARPDGLLVEVMRREAFTLATEVGTTATQLPQGSTHSREHAPEVLADMRRVHSQGRDPRGWQLVLTDPASLAAAADHLAAHPHSALVAATAVCDGHDLASRWS